MENEINPSVYVKVKSRGAKVEKFQKNSFGPIMEI